MKIRSIISFMLSVVLASSLYLPAFAKSSKQPVSDAVSTATEAAKPEEAKTAPANAEAAGWDICVPVALMPFVPNFGINGIDPVVYLPSGLAIGAALWFFGSQSDYAAMPYNLNTLSGFDMSVKAGWSLRSRDYSDKPKLSLGGLFGSKLQLLGHRNTSLSFFGGLEYMSRTETLNDYPENIMEGAENSVRPFIEMEFKNIYVLVPAWEHVLQLIFWDFASVSASARLYYNMPGRSSRVIYQPRIDYYLADPISYSNEISSINRFKNYYASNDGSVDASIVLRWLFLTLSWEQILSKSPIFNMSMNFTFNFANEDKRDESLLTE